MSEPQEPTPDAGDAAPKPQPPMAGSQPSTEPEPAPSTASPTEAPTVTAAQAEAPNIPPNMPPPPPGGPAGHYVFVPAGANRGFGPAMGRFARNRATHLVVAVVVGALVGGGTVAIVDNAANHQRPQFSRPGEFGGPFGNGSGHRFPGFNFGGGGQGSGN